MPLLANSACAVKLLEESGTLVSQSGFSNMVSQLTLTYSHQGQIRIQKKEIKSGSRATKSFNCKNRSQESTQGKYSERGKKTDVKKDRFTREAAVLSQWTLMYERRKLFCNACHELLSTKKSILQTVQRCEQLYLDSRRPSQTAIKHKYIYNNSLFEKHLN